MDTAPLKNKAGPLPHFLQHFIFPRAKIHILAVLQGTAMSGTDKLQEREINLCHRRQIKLNLITVSKCLDECIL